MPTLTTHNIEVKQKVLSMPVAGTTDGTETLEVSEEFYIVVTIKNPIGDPEPEAEDFGEDVTLDDTVDVRDLSDAATIRTTQFWYEYPQDWAIATPRRYSDATAPFPALPTNAFNIQFKDQRDVAQGYTQQIYWTE